jgi:lipopolysaccharide assembly protein A
MQVFKTVIWVIVAVLLTIFALANSTPAKVQVWPGWTADTNLSFVILVSFLAGFVPPFLIAMGNRWRLGRRLKQQEETIQLLRTPAAPVAPAVVQPVPAPAADTPGNGTPAA